MPIFLAFCNNWVELYHLCTYIVLWRQQPFYSWNNIYKATCPLRYQLWKSKRPILKPLKIHRHFSQMTGNLKFFCIDLLTLFQRKKSWIIMNYQLQNEVSKANFNTGKRFYNWPPFLKVDYRKSVNIATMIIFSETMKTMRFINAGKNYWGLISGTLTLSHQQPYKVNQICLFDYIRKEPRLFSLQHFYSS